jgi:hypothetical protein
MGKCRLLMDSQSGNLIFRVDVVIEGKRYCCKIYPNTVTDMIEMGEPLELIVPPNMKNNISTLVS